MKKWKDLLNLIIRKLFAKKPRKLNMQDYRLLFLLALIPLAGCTSTYAKYERFAEDGKTPTSSLSVHRRTLGSKVSMPKVTFNSDGSVTMEGYTNDGGNGIVASSVEAACKGAVKGAIGK